MPLRIQKHHGLSASPVILPYACLDLHRLYLKLYHAAFRISLPHLRIVTLLPRLYPLILCLCRRRVTHLGGQLFPICDGQLTVGQHVTYVAVSQQHQRARLSDCKVRLAYMAKAL